MDVSCGSTEGRYLFNPFRAWVRSIHGGRAIMVGLNSGRGPGHRQISPGNRECPQKPGKSGGSRISMELSVLEAWGGESELPRARKDANSPLRCLVCGLVHIHIIRVFPPRRVLPCGLVGSRRPLLRSPLGSPRPPPWARKIAHHQ